MSNKKRSYSNVSSNAHNHILSTTQENECSNVGEGLDMVVKNSMTFNELGLNENKIKKMQMIMSNLNKQGQNLTLENVIDRMIDTAFNHSVKVANIDTQKVINNPSLRVLGGAEIKINHFVEMIKEHNQNSEFSLKITQTLLANGLTSGNKDRTIDLSKIKASDKSFFASGTKCNRGAIKKVLASNSKFTDYNNSLSDLSTRTHNINSIKGLKKS